MTILTLLLVAITGSPFSLEWNPTWRTDVPYEVSIDASKAGVPSNLQVYADGKALETFLLEDKTRQEAIKEAMTRPTVYRFTVPAGTKALQMRPGSCKTVSSDVQDNMLSGSEWTADANAKATKTAEGWLLESVKWVEGKASYRVKVQAGAAGKPVVFEMDCKSVAKMTWPSMIYIRQYDAAGSTIPETVCDSRWTTLVRPPQKMTPFRETGYIHPKATELEVTVELLPSKPKYDSYGLPIKDVNDARPQLLVSRLALRPAATLPFPKFDDSFFGKGVSGQTGDNSLVFDGDRAFWYCTRSMAVWAFLSQYDARTEEEIFYPSGAGTVELWLKPYELKEKEIVILDGRHEMVRTYSTVDKRSVFLLSYQSSEKTLSLLLKDMDNKEFKSSCKCALAEGEWQHIAITFEPGSEARLYVNGHKVMAFSLAGYKPLDLQNEKYPNDNHALQFCIGAPMKAASYITETERLRSNIRYFKGEADLFRASTGARYSSDFTPARSFSTDKDTRALFDFNRSIDGVSGGGIGWISGTINAPTDIVDHVLTVGDRRVQYYPSEILDEFNSAKVLEPRVKQIPYEKEFAASDVRSSVSFDIKPGETRTVEAPESVYTDWVEIANTGSDVLLYPAVLRSDDIDARSYGDVKETLDVPGATDRQKANRFFNFLLKATDYFVTGQAYFDKGSDLPKRVSYQGLTLLNTYCGFECGPLNNIATTLFATAAGCPSNLLPGYAHRFEQVYYDGKNHHYDLSTQMFFTAMDNESAASLGDSDVQEYIQRRPGASGSHFTRRGSRFVIPTNIPYPEKFAISLNPGEKVRFYNLNEGVQNDLLMRAPNQTYKKIPQTDYSDICHAIRDPEDKAKLPGVYRVDRYFPEYGNGFITFDGKPEASNPAFVSIENDSFCYDVNTPYVIVAAEYTATLKNGKTAALELSTDGGKTFRPFSSPATYAVRARLGYLIRICAPISDVTAFKAVTEIEVNSRIITGLLRPGENEIRLKASAGTSAKVSYGLRSDGKPVTFVGAVEYGSIVGCEKSLLVLEPSNGQMKVKVNGVSPKARIAAAEGVDASVKNGVLTLSSKDRNAHMAWVTVADGDCEKTLCVMVCDGARLVKVGAELSNVGEKAEATFETIPAGDYNLFTLQRLPVDLDFLHETDAYLRLGNARKAAGCWPINTSTDLYKDIMGPDGGKGVWRWDSPLSNEYGFPYQPYTTFTTESTDKLSIELKGKESPLEISWVLVVPKKSQDFRNEITKYLFGRNHRPWAIAFTFCC